MKTPATGVAFALAFAILVLPDTAWPCTSFLVSKGAAADGSTMITYAADAHDFFGELTFTPAGKHAKNARREIHEWDSGKLLGSIPQPAVTYQVVGNMNEHQLVIGETTFGGRKELVDPEGRIDYGSLIYLALERTRTAREAIRLMGDLVAEYGYASSGESFSIADPNEVWLMELIGKGPNNKGAVWVARRIPDGYISAHANHARIRTFPLNDPDNCLYSPDVISFARGKGWFSGKDEEFSFTETYAPVSKQTLRTCEGRVWAMFRRAAPSLSLSSDYVLGVEGAEPLPLWIKPDAKLGTRDVMALMRDHYEGTVLDMTADLGAGPYKLPYRWRPLTWEVEGKKYLHERATSTQQTGFSFVSQSRAWLPDPVGGVLWFGVDDTASTVYVPMYAGMQGVPRTFEAGRASFAKFSWDSAFWVFNFVANYAYGRYSDMIQDIQKVQDELEGRFLADQQAFEEKAVALHARSPKKARQFLTDYSVKQGDEVTARWRELGEGLIVKYLDGNVRVDGKATFPGYPADWLRRIQQDRGEHLELERKPAVAGP